MTMHVLVLLAIAPAVRCATVTVEAGGSIILENGGTGGGGPSNDSATVAQLVTQMAAMAARVNSLEVMVETLRNSVDLPPPSPPPAPRVTGTWNGVAMVDASTTTGLTIVTPPNTGTVSPFGWSGADPPCTPGGSCTAVTFTAALASAMGRDLQTCRSNNEVNTADSNTVVLDTVAKAYLVRAATWNAVDLNGWTHVADSQAEGAYLAGYAPGQHHWPLKLYTKDFPAGTHAIDNNSGLLLFCGGP